VFLYACFWASREEEQAIMQKAMEVEREKECYTLLRKEMSPLYAVLRKRLLCISGVSREPISGNPDSPTFPHIGEPSLKISVPAASIRGH